MSLANAKLQKIPVYLKKNNRPLPRNHPLMVAIEKFFYRHKEKLLFMHIAMFAGFILLTVLPVFLSTPDESSTIFNNFTLLSQFLIWGIWFPLVFASVIFSGRSWCGILCPMGAASEWANKIGFQRSIPGWLKWEGTPIISFLIVTILGQTIDVRDQADAILELFGGTLILALLIGFFYGKKKRAWCRHVCPIGLLLGVFSRIGAVQFAPKDPHPGGDLYTEKGICPTMISINRKQESRHCIQCFRCVKPTSPGGLFVRLRKFGEEIIRIREHNPNFAEVMFIFLGTGIALGGFLWLILPEYQTLRQIIG
ncbi:MAG TPA: 4Fe-4S binding protein, partial [Gammaproteobacteria bacterium]|nr:4Fe-4S binding protein [Gammaproteobacteria bacterium]